MNEIIKVAQGQIDGEQVQTINARELYEFLGVNKDFSNWIKGRIESFDFVENQDFVCSPILATEGRGGHNRIDYHLSLDMAKELSMVERNEKGKQARQYFIECERRAKDPMILLNDPIALRNLCISYSDKVISLETRCVERDKIISVIQPQADAYRRIALADGSLCLTDAAKTLVLGPKSDFVPWLSENRWIYKRKGGVKWIAYQEKIEDGLLLHKVSTTQHGNHERIHHQVLVTPKGLAVLAKIFTGTKPQIAEDTLLFFEDYVPFDD